MEEKLANVILGDIGAGDTFKLKYFGINLTLTINPLSVSKIIRVSKYLSKISEIKEEEQTIFHVLSENSKDLNYICKAIAVAIDFPFKRFIYSAIKKLPLTDIETLFKIVIKNSDATFFLNIMVSAKNMNVMKKQKVE